MIRKGWKMDRRVSRLNGHLLGLSRKGVVFVFFFFFFFFFFFSFFFFFFFFFLVVSLCPG